MLPKTALQGSLLRWRQSGPAAAATTALLMASGGRKKLVLMSPPRPRSWLGGWNTFLAQAHDSTLG